MTTTMTTNVSDTHNMGIALNQHTLDVVTSKLYSDRHTAVVRELGTNAWEVSPRGKPPEIELNRVEQTLTVLDYGPGMDGEQVQTLFCTLFASSKSFEEGVIGGFGLGCKSPFALTDQFTVVTGHGPSKTVYTIYRSHPDTGMPGYVAAPGPSGADYGTKIIVPLSYADIQPVDDAVTAFKRLQQLVQRRSWHVPIRLTGKFQGATPDDIRNEIDLALVIPKDATPFTLPNALTMNSDDRAFDVQYDKSRGLVTLRKAKDLVAASGRPRVKLRRPNNTMVTLSTLADTEAGPVLNRVQQINIKTDGTIIEVDLDGRTQHITTRIGNALEYVMRDSATELRTVAQLAVMVAPNDLVKQLRLLAGVKLPCLREGKKHTLNLATGLKDWPGALPDLNELKIAVDLNGMQINMQQIDGLHLAGNSGVLHVMPSREAVANSVAHALSSTSTGNAILRTVLKKTLLSSKDEETEARDILISYLLTERYCEDDDKHDQMVKLLKALSRIMLLHATGLLGQTTLDSVVEAIEEGTVLVPAFWGSFYSMDNVSPNSTVWRALKRELDLAKEALQAGTKLGKIETYVLLAYRNNGDYKPQLPKGAKGLIDWVKQLCVSVNCPTSLSVAQVRDHASGFEQNLIKRGLLKTRNKKARRMSKEQSLKSRMRDNGIIIVSPAFGSQRINLDTGRPVPSGVRNTVCLWLGSPLVDEYIDPGRIVQFTASPHFKCDIEEIVQRHMLYNDSPEPRLKAMKNHLVNVNVYYPGSTKNANDLTLYRRFYDKYVNSKSEIYLTNNNQNAAYFSRRNAYVLIHRLLLEREAITERHSNATWNGILRRAKSLREDVYNITKVADPYLQQEDALPAIIDRANSLYAAGVRAIYGPEKLKEDSRLVESALDALIHRSGIGVVPAIKRVIAATMLGLPLTATKLSNKDVDEALDSSPAGIYTATTRVLRSIEALL